MYLTGRAATRSITQNPLRPHRPDRILVLLEAILKQHHAAGRQRLELAARLRLPLRLGLPLLGLAGAGLLIVGLGLRVSQANPSQKSRYFCCILCFKNCADDTDWVLLVESHLQPLLLGDLSQPVPHILLLRARPWALRRHRGIPCTGKPPLRVRHVKCMCKCVSCREG